MQFILVPGCLATDKAFTEVAAVMIGDGKTALFWKDLWTRNVLVTHPRAFSFARNENALVVDILNVVDLGNIFHLLLSIQAREEGRARS